MTTVTPVTRTDGAVIRPLNVLIPLIKENLKEAKETADSAAMPYYRAAGEKMLEAKPQLSQGEFGPWVTRHFKISPRHAQSYMALARATADTEKRTPGASFSSLDDFKRRHLGHNRIPGSRRDVDWQKPVKRIMGTVDLDALNRRRDDSVKRLDEMKARSTLALQLIEIGFKALATKLHPDKNKGGSRDAMVRLNDVRKRLREYATTMSYK